MDSLKSLMVKLRTKPPFFYWVINLSMKSVILIPNFLNSPNIFTESPFESLASFGWVLAGFLVAFFLAAPAWSPVYSLIIPSSYFSTSTFVYFGLLLSLLLNGTGSFWLFPFTIFEGSLPPLISEDYLIADSYSSTFTPLSITENAFPISLLKIDFSIWH